MTTDDLGASNPITMRVLRASDTEREWEAFCAQIGIEAWLASDHRMWCLCPACVQRRSEAV